MSEDFLIYTLYGGVFSVLGYVGGGWRLAYGLSYGGNLTF